MYVAPMAVTPTFAQPILFAMRQPALFAALFLFHAALHAQVFMRPFDNAAAMGMGGATIAVPVFLPDWPMKPSSVWANGWDFGQALLCLLA